MQLPGVSRTAREQRVEELDAGGDDDGRIPILSGKLAERAFLVVTIRIVFFPGFDLRVGGLRMMFENDRIRVGVAEDGLQFTGRLLDYV